MTTECSYPSPQLIIISVIFSWLHLVCKTVPSARRVPGCQRNLSVTLEDPVLWPSGAVRKWGLPCSCKFYLHLHVIWPIFQVCYCDGSMLFLKFPLVFRPMWKYWSCTARQTRLWLFGVMRSFGKLHLLLKSSQKNILLLKCKITCIWTICHNESNQSDIYFKAHSELKQLRWHLCVALTLLSSTGLSLATSMRWRLTPSWTPTKLKRSRTTGWCTPPTLQSESPAPSGTHRHLLAVRSSHKKSYSCFLLVLLQQEHKRQTKGGGLQTQALPTPTPLPWHFCEQSAKGGKESWTFKKKKQAKNWIWRRIRRRWWRCWILLKERKRKRGGGGRKRTAGSKTL